MHWNTGYDQDYMIRRNGKMKDKCWRGSVIRTCWFMLQKQLLKLQKLKTTETAFVVTGGWYCVFTISVAGVQADLMEMPASPFPCFSSLPLLLLHPSLILLPPTHPSFSLFFPLDDVSPSITGCFWFLHPSASASHGLRLQWVGHKIWLCGFTFKISFSNNEVRKLSQSYNGP